MPTFGETFFRELETNTYLMELYNDVLYNYSLKTFNIDSNRHPQKSLNIPDLLRFADLLSKSNDPSHSDLHKMWAQEIVALLYDLYPDDPNVQFFTGAILHSVGNYQGQKLIGSTFDGLDVYDRIYSECRKKWLAIPAAPEKNFFIAQKQVYDHLSDDYFSYCAPTSMGKSYIFRMFIKERILLGCNENYAIIVPTKALINEFRSSLTDELRDLLQQHNYRIATAVWEKGVNEDHNFIFVLTPERLLYLLIQMSELQIDYLFIDEAHKLTASKEHRAPVYYKVIAMLSQRNRPPKMIFSSPCIPNPEIYLDAIPGINLENTGHYSSVFSPVAQVKYMITQYDGRVRAYNDHTGRFVEFDKFFQPSSITELVQKLGSNPDGSTKQSIIYCSARSAAIEVARNIAESRNSFISNDELQKLISDVKREIHHDYFLAEVLSKGVAYHVGYLPTNIRQRIEKLYINRVITTIVCTSTLIEGVNLPAENLFIMSYKRAQRNMTEIEFRNMIGRIGRLEYNLFGNVFMFVEDEKEKGKFESYLKNTVPKQKLAPDSSMSGPQRKLLVDSLIDGEIDFEVPQWMKISVDQYASMRQYATMLVRDIIAEKESRITEVFKKELNGTKRQQIKDVFSRKQLQQDDNINISVNQTERLWNTLQIDDVHYPSIDENGNIDYHEVLAFLEKLCQIYEWDKCEKDTLGYRSYRNEHTKLKWYAVILCQWIRGNGLGLIIHSAIRHKEVDPNAMIEEYKNHWIPYDGSLLHKNLLISDVLSVVENVILFKLSNYFLRFSESYKRMHGELINDWYEFIEYGTTDKNMVWLQQSGYDREAARYICNRCSEFIKIENGEPKLLFELLQTVDESGIAEQSERIWFNSPELFICEKRNE